MTTRKRAKAKAVPEAKRTSVMVADVIWQAAHVMMERKGYNKNFSQYVADLIREDRKRQEAEDERRNQPPPVV